MLGVKLWMFVAAIGWYPELVILAVVFSISTDLAGVIPNSTIKRKLFYSKTSWKPLSYRIFILTQFIEEMHYLIKFLKKRP